MLNVTTLMDERHTAARCLGLGADHLLREPSRLAITHQTSHYVRMVRSLTGLRLPQVPDIGPGVHGEVGADDVPDCLLVVEVECEDVFPTAGKLRSRRVRRSADEEEAVEEVDCVRRRLIVEVVEDADELITGQGPRAVRSGTASSESSAWA